MEKIKRSIFFWSLVALFLVVAPLVVLHARGYRFDIHRGVFVFSGTITLKSNPQDITVTLNGKVNDSKSLNRINNSYNLTGLLPRDYNIKISADGFKTWEKNTEVHSGLSSEFWNVLLVRKDYERTEYDSAGTTDFYTSPRNSYIAYTQSLEDGLMVKILNINSKANETVLSFPNWKFIDKSREENIEWSPEEDYLSLPVEKTEEQKSPEARSKKSVVAAPEPEKKTTYAYYVVQPADNSSFNLNEFLGLEAISHVRWDPKNRGFVFFLNDHSLFRASISDKTDIVKIASDVSTYDLSRDNVYYSQTPNGIIYKSSLDGRTDPTQITATFPEGYSPLADKLIMYDNDRFAIINDKKELFIYNRGEHGEYFRKIGTNTDGVHFSDDGKKLLFYSDHEISAYFLRDWKVQPIRNEDDLTQITRYSDTIDNVQWFKDYEHVLFNTGPYIKIIELDPRDRRICEDLLTTSSQAPFVRYNAYLEKLFFTDKKGSLNTMYSIEFPEEISALGIGVGGL